MSDVAALNMYAVSEGVEAAVRNVFAMRRDMAEGLSASVAVLSKERGHPAEEVAQSVEKALSELLRGSLQTTPELAREAERGVLNSAAVLLKDNTDAIAAGEGLRQLLSDAVSLQQVYMKHSERRRQ